MYGELKKISKIIECFIAGDWGEESSFPNAENQYFCIRGADINAVNQGEFDKIPLRCTSFKSLQNKKLKKGDIVIEKSGGSPAQSTGRTCFISQELIESRLYVLCSNFCVAIRCKTEWNSKYVFYFLNYIYDQGVFFNFEGKTSGLKNLQVEAAFDSIKIPVIQRKKQDQIVCVLDAIEKRICNLRKQNSVIEQIAKIIYDYTFLQCAGYQTTYNKTLNRNIPADWKVKKMKEVCKVLLGGTPSTKRDDYWLNGTVNWLNSGEVAEFPIIDCEKKITKKAVEESSTVFLPKGSVTLSITRYLRPSILAIDACINQSVAGILENGILKKSYLFPMLKTEVPKLNALRGGAQQPHINKDVVENINVVIPPKEVLDRYYSVVDPIYEKIFVNSKLLKELIIQRNTLLPLLMTGQIEV